MFTSSWTLGCALALGCLALLGKRYVTKTKYRGSLPLPPGPPGLPFIGNVIGIDMNAPWKTYAEWAKTYGDIIYTRLFDKDIIIINSDTVAKELLDNRSANYSDRPDIFTAELCGVGFNSATMRYGERWRLHRRFFHQTYRSEAASRFVPMQHRKVCQFLRRLLQNPSRLSEHIFEYTASAILSSVYNYDVSSEKDELVSTVSKVLEIVVPVMRPDVSFIVDTFPAVLNLPSWLPGMSFKKEMAIAKEFSKEYVEKPFAYALKERMTNGTSSPSMVDDALQSVEEKSASVDETWMKALKESAATAFLGASETSNSVLLTFFLMMMVTPEAQKKAQDEIDAVVGNNRLPSIEDRPSLPYVDAVFRETLRYSPVNPLSFAHAAIEDDVYAGYHIPKGAVMIPNVWAMALNEDKYPNPHQYIPERFLNEDGSFNPLDIENIVFGFGRRICVGRHFADTSVWSVIAKTLAVFKILRPIDENGVEIPVVPKFSNGSTVHPLPFGFRIVPRISGMDASKLEELIAASTAE